MDLRHAAALALMGWYLMLPPYKADCQQVDTHSPLSAWTVARTFDSARGCKDYHRQLEITVAKDGNSFQSKCHDKVVAGINPLDPNATVLGEGDFGIQGKRIAVDPTLLP
jgi:hypothetical protein